MIGNLLSGLFGGSSAGKSEMDESNDLLRQNIANLEKIGIPTIEAQKIALETPEIAEQLIAEQMGPSAFEDVALDPRLEQSQYQALDEIANLASVGISPEDRAQLNQARREAAGQAQSAQQGILQQMAERGTLDSGSQLAAQLQAAQSSADRMSQEGDRIAEQGAAARRAALMNQANLSSQMQNQNLDLQSNLAQASDAISRFNTQNRSDANRYNVGTKQRVADAGVDIRNQQEIANKGLIQNKFNNEIARATGINNANTAMASNLQNQASAKQGAAQSKTAAIGDLIGTGISAYGAGKKTQLAQDRLDLDKDIAEKEWGINKTK